MYERMDAGGFEELLLPMSRRERPGVYFARVCGWDAEVREGVWAFHEAARRRGVVIDGGLSNPDGGQMAYLTDALGPDFVADEGFLEGRLSKWMPRLSGEGRRELAHALALQFDGLRRQGKTDSALRNLYFKVMCWLYYRFERLTPLLGGDDAPRVLMCCPAITAHELIMLRLLNALGADVLLLEPEGDAAYLKLDPASAASQLLVGEGTPFPGGFSLKGLRAEMTAPAPEPQPGRPRLTLNPTLTLNPNGTKPGNAAAAASRPAPDIDPLGRFKAPDRRPCANAWMSQADYRQILTPVADRGDDPGRFYNAYIRVRGVSDRASYVGDLRQFYLRLAGTGRRVCVQDGGLSMPTPQEVAAIRRGNYPGAEALIVGLAVNLPGTASVQLQRLMQRAFVETLLEAREAEPSPRRLLNSAVYLLCWIRRYQGRLFEGYRDGDMPCFILMGGCESTVEALYPKYLSRLPVDVLILAPDLNRPCALRDERLLELAGEESLPLTQFPRDAGTLRMDTLASQARDELDGLLYGNSGLYRSGQFSRAEALTLRTTYDELFILWGQALKYRSGFAAMDGVVTMPVLYAKVSGVEGGRADAYWQRIRGLLAEGDCLVRRLPMAGEDGPNPYRSLAVKAVSGRRLDRAALRRDPRYPFALLREELQNHMLDKLEQLLERRLVRGTFENGMEYTVVATVLNLDKELVRLLQSFDFTGKNPKLVCVSTDDTGASPEDAIRIAFLNLVGFDVALFAPTGYQTVERYLRDGWPVEHRVGPYQYDLVMPDLESLPRAKGGWLNHLFGRGS